MRVRSGPRALGQATDVAMSITADDIAREHREALASLTPEQRRALERLRVARQRTHFNGRFADENLRDMFAAEAGDRAAAAVEMIPLEADRARLAAALERGFPIAA